MCSLVAGVGYECVVNWILGVLGKRTKYQQTEVAQLVLSVTATSSNMEGGGVVKLPREVSLDDDTLLDKVKRSDPEEHRLNCLNPLQQATLLGWW